VLIIADTIRTIVVEPTTESVLALGGVVAIRIILSFALESGDGRGGAVDAEAPRVQE
jgi:uncharacterized membrane protein